MLTRVILAALVAGLLAGVFATAAQSVRVIPLILQAEAYEEGVSHAETEDEVRFKTVSFLESLQAIEERLWQGAMTTS